MPATAIVRCGAAKIDRMIAGGKAKKIALVLRVAGQQFSRSRTGSALLKGFRATAHSLGAVLHQLWLEVTGFTFLAIAAIGAITGVREYGKYHAGVETSPGRLILAVCFTLSFAWFGVSSFVRVSRNANRQREPR
ncbi:MAG: hypothetical protein WBQ72_07640 [Terriglobales bacterium]